MGSSNTVTLTFDANTQAAVRAWSSMEKAADSLNSKIQQVGKSGGRAGQQLGGAFDLSIGKISQVASGLVGVGSAAGAILAAADQLKKEWEAIKARQTEAAGVQISTAAAQRAAIGNLGDDKTLSIDELDKRIAAMSKKTGVSQKTLYEASSNAFSARGQLSGDETLEAVEAAAEFAPDNPGGLSTIAGSILDLQKKNGGSAREQMGFIKTAQQSARVESVQSFAANVAPVISQLQDFGNTQEQSAELVAAMSQSMNDIEGRMSGTAAISMAKHLEEALPEKKFPQLKSTMDRMKYLQSDEGKSIRDRLLYGVGKTHKGKIETEAKAYTTVRALLTPEDNATKKALKAAQEQIVAVGPESEAAFDKYNEDVNSRRIQQVADADRKAQANVEATQLNDKQSSAAVAREKLRAQLQASGVGDIHQRLALARFDVQTKGGAENPYSMAGSIAREQAERIGKQETTVPDWLSKPLNPQSQIGLPNVFEQLFPAPHGSTEQKSSESLHDFADTMERLQKSMDENTKATKENSKAKEEPSDSPAPRRTKAVPVSSNQNRQ